VLAVWGCQRARGLINTEGNVDMLHKKNLFSLGEDRFMMMLLLKHFPTFKTKFIPDAVTHTMAPRH